MILKTAALHSYEGLSQILLQTGEKASVVKFSVLVQKKKFWLLTLSLLQSQYYQDKT